MHAYLRPLLGIVALGAAGPLFAGEPASTRTEPQRTLLQPPRIQVPSPITDRFAIRGLFYDSDVTTSVRYDNDAGVPGTLIDGENMLGFPDGIRKPSLDIMFRMGERHRIHADFYKMRRSGEEVITQEMRFGEDIYQPGDRVVSAMALRKLGLGWTWSAVRTEKLELGLGVALHLMQLEGDLQVPARFERERLDAAGPFPSFAFDGTWRMSRRFSLNAAANWMDGTIEAVEGRYQYVHADVQFRVRPNLAVGAGYSMTQIRVDSATTDFAGFLDLEYEGPEVFLRVSF